MKAMGIVRKIDNLGRIVIPKEIRSTLKIFEGDSVEINVIENGNIVLKKYDQMGNESELIRNITRGIAETLKCNCIITDKEKVISAFPEASENLEFELDDEILDIVEEREVYVSDKKIVVPIIIDAVTKGAIIAVNSETKKKFTEADAKIIEVTSKLLEQVIG